MRFRLRTLLIVLALGPPVLAIAVVLALYFWMASRPRIYHDEANGGGGVRQFVERMRKDRGESATRNQP